MNNLIARIERLKLTSKLLLGFSVGILVALVIGLNALARLSDFQTEVEKMYEMDLLGLSTIKSADLNLIYIGRIVRQAILAQDDVTRDTAIATFRMRRENLLSAFADARSHLYRPEVIAKYETLQRDIAKALEYNERAISMLQRNQGDIAEVARLITSADFRDVIEKADDGLEALAKDKEEGAGLAIKLFRRRYAETVLLSMILLGLGLGLTALAGVLISISIQRPNNRLRNSVEALAAGKTDEPVPYQDYKNETGIMARSMAILQDLYRKADEQHWVTSQVAEISGALQQADDFRSLTQAVVSRIASATGAGHGAFYVADAEGTLNLMASYGYRERKHISSCFRAGEGLVGQCAMEKSPIMLTAPKDYIRISSGLGEGPPVCIIVVPIVRNDRVLGVLEMASFQQFSEREKTLLDAVLPTLAINLEILDRNLKTRELLIETQAQAERMEKQAAQLEEQTVEMEAQQSELLETENWFRSIIESAPDGILVADSSGRILLANPELEHIFGYASGELIGGNIERLVPDGSRDKHHGLHEAFMAAGRSRSMGDSARLCGRHVDGREIPISITLSPLPPRGTREKCVSVSVRRLEA